MPLKKAMFKSRQGIKRKSIDSEDGILKLWQIKTVHRLYHWKTPLTIKPWVFENIVILSDEQRSYKNLNGKLQFFKKKIDSFKVYLLLPWLFKILLQILKLQEFHVYQSCPLNQAYKC